MRTVATFVLSFAVVALSACGSADSGSSLSSKRIAALADASPRVAVSAPSPMLLPGPIANVTITGVDQSVDDFVVAAKDAYRGAQTLWADPAVADPLEGRMLLVGRTAADDVEGHFELNGRSVAVGAADAEVRRFGRFVIVAWPVTNTGCDGCDQSVVVAGRNLSEDQVLAAARAARAREVLPSIDPVGLPVGLRSFGTLPNLADFGRVSAEFGLVKVLVGSIPVDLRIMDGDERLAPHLRFWIDGKSAVGPYSSNWAFGVRIVGRHTVLFRASPGDLDAELLDAVVGSLHEVSAEEVADARRAATQRPVDEADRCDLGPSIDEEITFAGVIRDERWSLTMGVDSGGYSFCAGSGSGGGGGPAPAPGQPDEIRVLATDAIGPYGEEWLRVVGGDVPEQATKVKLTAGTAPPVEAQLSTEGPTSSRRWFAAAVYGEGPTGPFSVVAYDRAGRLLAAFP